MPKLYLTDFVDVVTRSGMPKATKISEVKNRPPYNPANDFYKPLKEGIVKLHRTNKPKQSLDDLLSSITDSKKHTNYRDIVGGYKKWWGNKSLSWFVPPKHSYSHSGVDVVVNPELGLAVNGQRHVVKLYLKEEKLNRLRVNIVTELLSESLSGLCQNGEMFSIFDVRRSKLFTFGQTNPTARALIDAELAYVATMWPHS